MNNELLQTYPVVTLSQDEIKTAWQYHHQIVAKVSHSPNYTGLTTQDRFFVGRCGEIALRHWLDANGLEYTETVRDDGIPDEQDFMLTKTGYTINIKNSHHPRAKYLLWPYSQQERHDYDLLVGASGKDLGSCVEVKLWGGVSVMKMKFEGEHTNFGVEALGWKLNQLPAKMPWLAKFLAKKI